MNTTSNPTPTPEQQAQLDAAKKELAKLPLLGPATWLFSRDPMRRFTFFADVDWRLLPPLVLDQCKLYMKQEMPWGFVTWARVSDGVDQRLRSSAPVIAPHEWHSGQHLWLIDVVSPFGDAAELAAQAVQEIAPGQSASVWLPGPNGLPSLREVKGHG